MSSPGPNILGPQPALAGRSLRPCALLVAVPLTLAVLVGVALTVSIFGAVFGVPLVLLSAWPWWRCSSVALGKGTPANWSILLRANLVAWVALASAAWLSGMAVGFDDVDTGVDVLLLTGVTFVVAGSIYGTVGLLRYRRGGESAAPVRRRRGTGGGLP